MAFSTRKHGGVSGPPPAEYSDDVFALYTYDGTGGLRSITNGIDFNKGAMVWTKCRNDAYEHKITDTLRGITSSLSTSTSAGELVESDGTYGYWSAGYSLGAHTRYNASSYIYSSMTFRRAPRFFDMVLYNGTGAAQTINHALTVKPAVMIFKRRDTTSDWVVLHKSSGSAPERDGLALQASGGRSAIYSPYNITQGIDGGEWAAGTSQIAIQEPAGGGNPINIAGGQYIAYLFADDPSPTGIIRCGGFTGGNATVVNLGWEPQAVIVKVANSTGSWAMFDSMRGVPVDFTGVPRMLANTNSAESVETDYIIEFTPTGFKFKSTGYMGYEFIYIAIRRPNKPPTSGSQVFKAVARVGTNSTEKYTGVGFAPDLLIAQRRTSSSARAADKTRGSTRYYNFSDANAENTAAATIVSFDPDGVTYGSSYPNNVSANYINWFFKKAPGVMDIVHYTGDSSAPQTVYHNLDAIPELAIIKARNAGSPSWLTQGITVACGSTLVGTGWSHASELKLNTNAAATDMIGGVFQTTPTNKVSYTTYWNGPGTNFIVYLFATLAGISKVGSFTGNGGSLNIDCGFTSGARFVMIKRTDSTGDWFVWDTARGINSSAVDPHLAINTTLSEANTVDSIAPYAAGFQAVYNGTTQINTSGGKYIYLAFA